MKKIYSFDFQQIATVFATLALPVCLFAQAGCPDPQASNYDPSATENDGSCLYPITNYFPPVKANLADTLAENSGLTLAGNQWWTLNDSGNDDTFFRFDPETGNVQQFVKLKQADNVDWEDITTDGDNIYIGDFGNNATFNTRTDLGIYKIPLFEIGNGTTTSVDNDEYTFIPFAYEDQTNFEAVPEDDVEFDCEGFVFHENALHLFTKNWKELTTTHYRLNEQSGQAENIETFDCQGLITSAAISPDRKLVALLGYNKSGIPNVFVWLLWDFRDGKFFNGNKRRLELGSPIVLGKSEAIAFKNDRQGYIANEFLELGGIVIVPQQTRTFDFSQFVPQTSGSENPKTGEGTFAFSPNPFSESVDIQWFAEKKTQAFRVRNAVGQTVFESKSAPEKLETRHWPAGTYFFETFIAGKFSTFMGVKE